MLSREFGRYKWYQNLIFSRKGDREDVGPSRGVDCGVPYRLKRGKLRSLYVRL